MLLINLIRCLLNWWRLNRLGNYRKTDSLRKWNIFQAMRCKTEERKRGRETGKELRRKPVVIKDVTRGCFA